MILRTTWNNSVPNPATGGYKVYRKIDAGSQQLLAQVPAGTNEYNDTVTSPVGTHSYQYGVSGLNNTGQESAIGWGTAQNFTINEPTPSVPTGVDTQQTG
jgi:hypothetical protein